MKPNERVAIISAAAPMIPEEAEKKAPSRAEEEMIRQMGNLSDPAMQEITRALARVMSIDLLFT